MRIYLIRHGETDWNNELRLQGREDIPLNDIGKKQALLCGQAMQGLAIDKIISSPLSRAKETASIIGNCIGVCKINVDEQLIERDFGEASGVTYQEYKLKYENKEVPGYEHNEPLLYRMVALVNRYQLNYPQESVVMVSHGAAIKVLLGDVAKGGPFVVEKVRLKNAGISVLEAEETGIKLIDFNMDPEEFAKKYNRM